MTKVIEVLGPDPSMRISDTRLSGFSTCMTHSELGSDSNVKSLVLQLRRVHLVLTGVCTKDFLRGHWVSCKGADYASACKLVWVVASFLAASKTSRVPTIGGTGADETETPSYASQRRDNSHAINC